MNVLAVRPLSVAADAFRPGDAALARWFDVGLILAGSLLMAASAQVVVPIQPVPITGQTFGVCLIAALLGRWRGAAAMAAYLLQGAIGLPVFAGLTGGVHVLLGPTAGYLWAFIPAAYVIGALAERGWDRSVIRCAAAMLIGHAVIFAGGLAVLGVWAAMAWPTETGAPIAGASLLAVGLWPFVPGTFVKVALAMALLPAGWRLLGRQR
ncbi:MAG: biotin transporter BioY [Phycisphaerales bacterium]|nr:biotin transporter BioY [Phycisphaerales bacterium]